MYIHERKKIRHHGFLHDEENYTALTCRAECRPKQDYSTEAEFLAEVKKKLWRVFLPAIHSHLYSFKPWDFYYSKLTQPLTVSTVQESYWTLFRIKEENLIENHTPFPMVQEIHTDTSSSLRTLKLMIMPKLFRQARTCLYTDLSLWSPLCKTGQMAVLYQDQLLQVGYIHSRSSCMYPFYNVGFLKLQDSK